MAHMDSEHIPLSKPSYTVLCLLSQELGNAEPVEVIICKETLHACQPDAISYMSTLRAIKQTSF